MQDIVTIEHILNNPPPGVDLTIVGGQALIYWTLAYQGLFPDAFTDDVITSTYDVDFVVQLKDACEACYAHWGGRLDLPLADDATPEFGRLVFNSDNEEALLRVDLLGSLFRLDRNTILKNRQPVSESDSRFKNMFVLTEWGVLLNRCFNSLSSSKYRHPEGLQQIRNALVVHHCRIKHLLAQSRVGKAQSETHRLLKLAEQSQIGMRLYFDLGIDLIDGVPQDDDRFRPNFRKNGLEAILKTVSEKRARLKRDQARRGL